MNDFIGLMPTIRKSLSNVIKNENLGYIVKYSFISTFLAFILLLPLGIILFLNLQPWTLYPTNNSGNNFRITPVAPTAPTVKGITSNINNMDIYINTEESTQSIFGKTTTGSTNGKYTTTYSNGVTVTSPYPLPPENPTENTFESDFKSGTSNIAPGTNPFEKSNLNNNGGYNQNEVLAEMGKIYLKGALIAFPILIFLITFYMIFMIKVTWNIENGNLENLWHVFKQSFKKFFSMLLLLIIIFIITSIGTILFIVPGIILSLMFMFAPFILVIEDCGPVEALKRSKKLVSGYKKNLFVKWLSFTGIIMVFWIPFMIIGIISSYTGYQGILSFLTSFVQQLILISFYKDLKRIKGENYYGALENPSNINPPKTETSRVENTVDNSNLNETKLNENKLGENSTEAVNLTEPDLNKNSDNTN